MDKKPKKTERWYDHDPLLKNIMKFLEVAPDDVKINVSMDIMQLIIQENYIDPDGLIDFAKENYIGDGKRWYDANEVTHAAVEMLKLIDERERQSILMEIAHTIMYFTANLEEKYEQLDARNRYLSDMQD